MKNLTINLSILLMALLFACSPVQDTGSQYLSEGPSHVEMREVDGRYRLFVNGEEFFVKGAGCEFGPCYQIAAHGGNSFRTWRTDNGRRPALEILDEAYEHGLMVMMGLDVARERHGFDYDDEVAVNAQLERFRQEVMELKDHPALLGWGIGNELNLRYSNMKVWDAVNDIARMIKEVDGNHVTTTMLAGIGPKEVEYIAANCPDIDFLSIQIYGELINLQEYLEHSGYDGPYLVTEWGPVGHWEMPQTKWGRPIEQTSTEKAESIKTRYKNVILADDEKCMGSYVFLWGQKQERTPSWYGLFTEDGERMEHVQMMEYLWTGEWPEHRAPKIHDISIAGKGGRFDNVKLDRNATYTALINIEHPEKQHLSVRAEIMPEPRELSYGGDYEPRPESIEGLIVSADHTRIVFKAPDQPGEYRILIYITDQFNYAGAANVPFYVN
ncbi:MAG: glycoside hydrolase family 2 TIM barrel-domain containing protein [Bacteroidales bacterium]|nr:glycoside hydrolase family 2 TIM barrel-domain containing protein [Bacteroidales bacterium]